MQRNIIGWIALILAVIAIAIGVFTNLTRTSAGDLENLKTTIKAEAKTEAAALANEAVNNLATIESVSLATKDRATYKEVFGIEKYEDLPKRIVSIDTTWNDELHTEVASVDTTWEVIPLVELIGSVKPAPMVAKEEVAVKKEKKLPSIFQ